MPVFKTIRGEALNDSDITIEQKVCHAACDYLYAREHDDFASEHGGVNKLREDLSVFVGIWLETLPQH